MKTDCKSSAFFLLLKVFLLLKEFVFLSVYAILENFDFISLCNFILCITKPRFDVLTTCQPSTVWCSRERLPAAAAQPAKVRQSL
jgi:hypothetical protein